MSLFTPNAKYDKIRIPSPEIHLSINRFRSSKLVDKIRLSFFTNFHDYDEVDERISIGPGLKEMGKRDYHLFDIKTYTETNIEAPDKRHYPIVMHVEIPIGVPTKD